MKKTVSHLRFVSVDLADTLAMSLPPNRDSGIPHPAELPKDGPRPRFMPWRMI